MPYLLEHTALAVKDEKIDEKKELLKAVSSSDQPSSDHNYTNQDIVNLLEVNLRVEKTCFKITAPCGCF